MIRLARAPEAGQWFAPSADRCPIRPGLSDACKQRSNWLKCNNRGVPDKSRAHTKRAGPAARPRLVSRKTPLAAAAGGQDDRPLDRRRARMMRRRIVVVADAGVIVDIDTPTDLAAARQSGSDDF